MVACTACLKISVAQFPHFNVLLLFLIILSALRICYFECLGVHSKNLPWTMGCGSALDTALKPRDFRGREEGREVGGETMTLLRLFFIQSTA